MKKYKLINQTTKEESICEKVEVDGINFYIGDIVTNIEERNVWHKTETKFHPYLEFIGNTNFAIEEFQKGNFLKIIAVDGDFHDLPKVVDEVEKLFPTNTGNIMNIYQEADNTLRQEGYNHSQSTHPNSDEDMIEFKNWCELNTGIFHLDTFKTATTKELLQLWKDRRVQTIYFN